jgi:riboflavin transporter FmnP
VSANAAYATLIGELGPKSILLLLIGLVAGVVVRFVVRLLRRLVSRATASDPVGEHA